MGKGFYRKNPPVPPRPKRLNAFTWNPTLRDVRDVDIGIQFTEQVEPKLGHQFQAQRETSSVEENKKEFAPDPVSPDQQNIHMSTNMKVLLKKPKMMRNPSK